jgi:rod shape-determining protein MreB
MKIFAGPALYVRLRSAMLCVRNVNTGDEIREEPLLAMRGGILVDGSKPEIVAIGASADACRGHERVVVVNPFLHPRALLADFQVAEKVLAYAFAKVYKRGIFRRGPTVVFQPLEMLEGGLTQIEQRAFHELCLGAGAEKFTGWVGPELSDDEILSRSFVKDNALIWSDAARLNVPPHAPRS